MLACLPACLPAYLLTCLPCRWKQRIHEELSHRAYFQNSATKRGGEVVLRLNPDALDGLPRKQYKKLEELKLPGAPFLGKLGKGK